MRVLDASTPIFLKLREFLVAGWALAKPYHPEEWTPVFIGLIMLYCGGASPNRQAD